MKRIFIFLVLGILLFSSCMINKAYLYPLQDVVFVVEDSEGKKSIVFMKKGFFNKEGHGKSWMFLEEYKEKLMREDGI